MHNQFQFFNWLESFLGIGADIVDTTGQNMMLFGELKTEDTWWEMTKEQQIHFDQMGEINEYLREEYHSLKDILWMFDTYNILKTKIPARYSLNRKYSVSNQDEFQFLSKKT